MTDQESTEAQLGILFVHGIGIHAREQTLRSFGQPILDWLTSWFGDSSPMDDAIPGSDRSVSEPDASGPAHWTVQLGVDKDRQSQTWLLCESNWDQITSAPPSAKVARWVLRVWPWIFWSHLLPILKRNQRKIVWTASGFTLVVFLIVMASGYPLTMFFNIILGPFLAVVFVAALWPVFRFLLFITLLSVSLITHRFPKLHKLLGLQWLQGTLADVIGDSC